MELDIRQIYKEVLLTGLKHCRVCFRSAKETKLVKPQHLVTLVDNLSLDIFTNVVDIEETVCYMCEGKAASALKLIYACVNSTHIQDIFKNIKKSTNLGMRMRRNAKEYSENLKKYRQQITLKQTEILNVDNLVREFERNNTSHQILSRMGSVSGAPEKDIEMVVLSDDDDKPPTVSSSKQTVTSKNEKLSPKRYKRGPVKKGNIPLPRQYGIKKRTSQQIKGKTIQNEIIKGDVPKMPKMVPLDKLLDYPPSERANVASLMPNKMQLINGQQENFVLHPVVLGSNGNLVVPSFGAEIRNNELVFDPTLLKPMPVVDATGGMILIQNGQIMPYKQQDTIKPQQQQNTIKPQQQQDKIKPYEQEDNFEPDRSIVTYNGKVIGTRKNKPKETQSSSNNAQIEENVAVDKPTQNVIDYNIVVEYTDPNSTKEQNGEVDMLLRKALINRKRPTQHENTAQEAREEYVVDLDIVNNLLSKSEHNSDEMAVMSEVASSYIENNSDISFKHMVNRTYSRTGNSSDILISNVTSSYNMDSDSAPIAIISDVTSQAVPPEKTGKIDWEDKIPMDVISYMDATDPNAETETIVPDRSDPAPVMPNPMMCQIKEEDDTLFINLC